MPKHENVIRHFVNIELFHKADSKKEDCIGWITIMERVDQDLRTVLKAEKIDIEKRKKIFYKFFAGVKNTSETVTFVTFVTRITNAPDIQFSTYKISLINIYNIGIFVENLSK